MPPCCYLPLSGQPWEAWEPFRDLIPEDERNCFYRSIQQKANFF